MTALPQGDLRLLHTAIAERLLALLRAATRSNAPLTVAGVLPSVLELMDQATIHAVEEWRHLGLDTTSPTASRSSRVRIDGTDHGAGNGIQAWRRRGRLPRSARAAREPVPPSCRSA